MNLKIKAFRSTKYFDAVKEIPCCICKNPESIPHHVKGKENGGGSVKAPDHMVLPLCHSHHMKLHDGGYLEWEFDHGHQVDHARRTREILWSLLLDEWNKFYMKHLGYVPDIGVSRSQ